MTESTRQRCSDDESYSTTLVGVGGAIAAAALALCSFTSLSAGSESPGGDRTMRPAAQAATSQAARPPRTDNLVALEMGGRVENQPARPGDARVRAERALDGDAKTMWAELFPPATIVLSFIGRDTALVASVSIASPNADSPPPYGVNLTAARPRAVEISLSTTSPTTGFVKAISAPLPDDDNEHVVKLPAPAEARFIKLTFPPPTPASYGKNGIVVGEIAVHEGARAGYTPLLQRHPDLQALLSSGKLTPDAASLAYQAPGAATGSSCVAPSVAAAECPESKSRAGRCHGAVAGTRRSMPRESGLVGSDYPLLRPGSRQGRRRRVHLQACELLAPAAGPRAAGRPRAERARGHGGARAGLRHQDERPRRRQAGARRVGRQRQQADHPDADSLRPEQRAGLLVPAVPVRDEQSRRARRGVGAPDRRAELPRQPRLARPGVFRRADLAAEEEREHRRTTSATRTR